MSRASRGYTAKLVSEEEALSSVSRLTAVVTSRGRVGVWAGRGEERRFHCTFDNKNVCVCVCVLVHVCGLQAKVPASGAGPSRFPSSSG